MSYSWIGPPTQFNGTDDITGGDSREYKFTYATCARAERNTHLAQPEH